MCGRLAIRRARAGHGDFALLRMAEHHRRGRHGSVAVAAVVGLDLTLRGRSSRRPTVPRCDRSHRGGFMAAIHVVLPVATIRASSSVAVAPAARAEGIELALRAALTHARRSSSGRRAPWIEEVATWLRCGQFRACR